MVSIDWNKHILSTNQSLEKINTHEVDSESPSMELNNQNLGSILANVKKLADLNKFEDTQSEETSIYSEIFTKIKRWTGFEKANGKIEDNSQQIRGNCEFLAIINSLIDRNEELGEIMTVNDDGSIDIKFHNNDEKTIHVTNLECSLPFYKIMGLSVGDKDVKALEIAYYKMLEGKGYSLKSIWKATPSGHGALKLLFSPDKYVLRELSNNLSIDPDNESFKNELKLLKEKLKNGEIDNEEYKDMYSDLISGMKYKEKDRLLYADLSKLNGTYAFTGTYSFDKRYLKLLNEKKQKLIDMGYDEKEVTEAIKKVSKARAELLIPEISSGRYYFKVPTKSGENVELMNGHGYTFLGVEDGYVKLRNPWYNQKIIEIPELYYKLIFEDIEYARPKTESD